MVHDFLESLGVKELAVEPGKETFYENGGFNLKHGKEILGKIGLVKKSVGRSWDINSGIWYAELSSRGIFELSSKGNTAFREISKFQVARVN